MLSRLSIQNYAIIEHLEVDFSAQLNVITGETGAGKSIIIGALGLILGQRADSSVLLFKNRKCIVEGYFSNETANEPIVAFLKAHELDVYEELTVRREISAGGKSRAFINDTPVNLVQLNTLSALLVDLHQQFDTMAIAESNFQREVLDALAGTGAQLKSYQSLFAEALTVQKQLEALQEKKLQFEKELDYNQFQYSELEEAGFQEDELERLDAELQMLTNAEGIKMALSRTTYQLEESEEPLIRQLKSMASQLQHYAHLNPTLAGLGQRLQSACIELQDIADEAGRINNQTAADAAAIDKINERMALGYRLLKKHDVKTTGELLQIAAELKEKLQAVLNIDDAIATSEKSYQMLLAQAQQQALKISELRKSQVQPLQTQVNKMLAQVGMPGARFSVAVENTPLGKSGIDDVIFLFDANKSNQFQPLRKVASGGELSRLMLCIKSLVAASMNLPTLIFDEIDTGISGEAARQVGIIMKQLSASRQVICITHQPQIAGKADAHLLVYKAVAKDSVTTSVKLLSKDERIVAIAKMLSGEKPTAAAMENAREMVMN